jgi:FixJ family two-component response regulator
VAWLLRAELAALQQRYDALTPPERDVMRLVVSGLLNKQIAAELGSSDITIKMHRGQVMRKMRAESCADLVRMAERLGIPATRY